MAKTYVVAKHAPGPHVNGHDGCHARSGHAGMCPGLQIADWLNSLGDDDEQYIKWPSGQLRHTNGHVRDNWIRESDHIVAREPYLVNLRAEERRLTIQLRDVRTNIAKCMPKVKR